MCLPAKAGPHLKRISQHLKRCLLRDADFFYNHHFDFQSSLHVTKQQKP
jgi:hypothetical protein